MAEILLHKQALNSSVISKLAKEGVIAIRTDSPDDFKFLSLQPAAIKTDDFVWACLDSLNHSGKVTSSGAARLVQNLTDLANKAKS